MGLKDSQLSLLEVHIRMLLLACKLRKVPEDVEDPAAHAAKPRSRDPPTGVKLSVSIAGESHPFAAKVSCIFFADALFLTLCTISFFDHLNLYSLETSYAFTWEYSAYCLFEQWVNTIEDRFSAMTCHDSRWYCARIEKGALLIADKNYT